MPMQDGLQALQEANPAPPFDAEKATPAQKMNRPADNDFLKYSVRLLSNARWGTTCRCWPALADVTTLCYEATGCHASALPVAHCPCPCPAARRWDELDKVQAWSGPTLQLGLFRMIRTQRFIDFTGVRGARG